MTNDATFMTNILHSGVLFQLMKLKYEVYMSHDLLHVDAVSFDISDAIPMIY